MNLKELVVEHCSRRGIPKPPTVAGSTDAQVVQMLGLLNEELDELTSRENYNWAQRECVFLAVAGEYQQPLYGVGGLIGSDRMWRLVPKTFFNRTTHLACEGPITEQEWQQYEALKAGMLPRFRFWQDALWLQPAPTPGHEYAFEYLTIHWVNDHGAGTEYKQYFTNDNDTTFVPDAVLLAALAWRWKAEKRLDYSEEFGRYERIRANYIMTSGLKRDVDVGGHSNLRGPGIIVPPGSWNIPNP